MKPRSARLLKFKLIFLAETCDSNTDLSDTGHTNCPNKIGASLSLGVYVIYILFAQILLVNLLIAIFK